MVDGLEEITQITIQSVKRLLERIGDERKERKNLTKFSTLTIMYTMGIGRRSKYIVLVKEDEEDTTHGKNDDQEVRTKDGKSKPCRIAMRTNN